MNRRELGQTGLTLTEFSFGAAGIGNLYREVSREDAMATLDLAWEAGIRYFDTAPHYGHGLSERRTGDFLRGKPTGSYVLSTKVGRLLKPVPEHEIPDHGFVRPLPFAQVHDYSYDGIMRSYEDSLTRLGMNAIDILYIHDLETATLGADSYHHHFGVFIDSGRKALESLKSSGAVKAIGLGVNEVPACLNLLAHMPLDVILLAGRYTLLDRSAEPALMELCRRNGTRLVIGGVFNSGILATGARPGATFNYTEASPQIMDQVRALENAATASGSSLATAAMHFPLREPMVTSVLIGTGSPASLRRNVAMFGQSLPDATWDALDIARLSSS
ncbi:aldo/keto reductase [Acidisoma cellulosilytica]|uniref:Aldo/keto reductase n=1 Tax=Acidisoma cellulosilyticum TaxID=2802395 RepID=A0A963Z3M8_9PROT|nr:aldo/keto reductase [Acidisoma cellulosilyticum]MCB8881307.1 aldo/keto reductase [Acidisoma cellulosilyticum]